MAESIAQQIKEAMAKKVVGRTTELYKAVGLGRYERSTANSLQVGWPSPCRASSKSASRFSFTHMSCPRGVRATPSLTSASSARRVRVASVSSGSAARRSASRCLRSRSSRSRRRCSLTRPPAPRVASPAVAESVFPFGACRVVEGVIWFSYKPSALIAFIK